MQVTLILPVVEAIVFGLVVSAVELLIGGSGNPWPMRQWLARTWVYACFCWIILFGLIKL